MWRTSSVVPDLGGCPTNVLHGRRAAPVPVFAVEEFWVKPVEESDARRRAPDIVISRELGDGDDGADQHEDDDEHLYDDPKAGKLHRPSATR